MDATKIMSGAAIVIALAVGGKSLYTTDTKPMTAASGKAEDVSAAKLAQLSKTVKDIPCWIEYVQPDKGDKVALWMCMTDTGPAAVDEPEQRHLGDIGGSDATAILKKARRVGNDVIYDSEITRGEAPVPHGDVVPAEEVKPVEAEKP